MNNHVQLFFLICYKSMCAENFTNNKFPILSKAWLSLVLLDSYLKYQFSKVIHLFCLLMSSLSSHKKEPFTFFKIIEIPFLSNCIVKYTFKYSYYLYLQLNAQLKKHRGQPLCILFSQFLVLNMISIHNYLNKNVE